MSQDLSVAHLTVALTLPRSISLVKMQAVASLSIGECRLRRSA